MTTTLALVVKCIVKGVVPGRLGKSNGSVLLQCMILVLLVKLFLFDVHIAETPWHALRCSKSGRRATLWLSLVPVAMAGVMMMGAGCFLVLKSEFGQTEFGQEAAGPFFGHGFAIMVLAATCKRLLHKSPGQLQAFTLICWQVQVFVQILCGLLALALAHCLSGPSWLLLSLSLTALLIALNFADEVEELSHHRSNWQVGQTIGQMSNIVRLMQPSRAHQPSPDSSKGEANR